MSDQIPQLAEFRLPISGLYALAAPSTPPEARAEFIERAQEGEPVPVAEIRRVVEKHKARKKPKLTARQRKIARNKAQRERWIEESRRRAEERKVFEEKVHRWVKTLSADQARGVSSMPTPGFWSRRSRMKTT